MTRTSISGLVGGLAAEALDLSKPPSDIFQAAARNDTTYIKRAVERTLEFDINSRDTLHRTALHWAAELGAVQAAELLIDYNIDVKACECNGRTAVHLAARAGSAEVLQTIFELLTPEERASLANQTDNFGLTPVYLAKSKDQDGLAALEALLLNGGKLSEEASAKKPAI